MAAMRRLTRHAFTLLAALSLMFVFILLPYFTFGEDLLMMTEIDYDVIMALAVVFGVFTASISISEEIEGRTAITLMSKPLSRRIIWNRLVHMRPASTSTCSGTRGSRTQVAR